MKPRAFTLVELAVVVACLPCSRCFGQRALERGSPEAHRAIMEAQRDGLRTKARQKAREAVLTKGAIDPWIETQTKELSKKLAAAKRGTISARARSDAVWSAKAGRYQFRSRLAKEKAIKEIQAGLAMPRLPTLWPFTLRRGMTGSLGHQWLFYLHVTQILNENTAILERVLKISFQVLRGVWT